MMKKKPPTVSAIETTFVPSPPVSPGQAPSSPIPELTEAVLRHLLGAMQCVHRILAVARPDLKRARVEMIDDPSGKVVGWFAVATIERCRVELRDVVTGKEVVFPVPLTGPAAKLPSDNPMIASAPKIPPPTDYQRNEIAELVTRLGLSDEDFSAILRRLKVRGGVETIGEYAIAARVLGVLHTLSRNKGMNSKTASGDDALFEDAVKIVLKAKRGSGGLVQRELGIGYTRASRLIERMAASGILGEHQGHDPREVLMTAAEWKALER